MPNETRLTTLTTLPVTEETSPRANRIPHSAFQMMSTVVFQVAGKSDVGLVRSTNEDNFGYDTRYGIFVV